MRRNLQTAAPLLRELAAMGSPVSARQHPLALNEPPAGPRRPAQRSPAPILRHQVTAVVRYGNFELMGIVHPDDAPAVARMDAMTDGAERAAFLKAAAWTPAGQSAAGLLTQRQGCCLFLVLSTGTILFISILANSPTIRFSLSESFRNRVNHFHAGLRT